jgi:arylsulfatase
VRAPPAAPFAASFTAVLAAAVLAGCAGEGPAGKLVHPGFNVIFILADTLRADHVGSYGYERATTPFLDELAATRIQFLNARSQSACTFPSVNSLLTSRHVFDFQDAATRPGIPEGIPSLAEILGDHGYATAAVSASPIVRRSPSKHNPRGGFGRGFDVFDERCEWYPSTCVTAVALKELRRLDSPFFLYLHYMDPHDPYVALPEHRGRFATAYEGEHAFIAEGDPNPIDRLIREHKAREALDAGDFRHLIDLYDEDVYSLDHGLRLLFEGLEARGLLERSLIVIASDHGEAFFEHGHVKHCFTVYDNETRVPLIMSLPRLAMPLRRTTWVQNLDLVPTLLDYLGIDGAAYGLAGRSLRPVIESDEAPARLAFSAMGPYRSVNDDRYKLVIHFGAKLYGLFDLVDDPGEERDVSAERREDFLRLRGELKAWTEEFEHGSEKERLRRAQEIEDELRALGYLGGSG